MGPDSCPIKEKNTDVVEHLIRIMDKDYGGNLARFLRIDGLKGWDRVKTVFLYGLTNSQVV